MGGGEAAPEVYNPGDGNGEFDNVLGLQLVVQAEMQLVEKVVDAEIVDLDPEDIGSGGTEKGLENLRMKDISRSLPEFFGYGLFLVEDEFIRSDVDIQPVGKMQYMALERDLRSAGMQ